MKQSKRVTSKILPNGEVGIIIHNIVPTLIINNKKYSFKSMNELNKFVYKLN